MIYFGRTYYSTVAGGIWKNVVCEACQQAYTYFMRRTARGAGSSPYLLNNDGAVRRATDAAQRALERVLAKECDPVACPSCGWIQKPMVKRMRRGRWRKLLLSGWVVAFAAMLIAGIALLTEDHISRSSKTHRPAFLLPIVWLPLAAGIGMIGLASIARRMYDPNANYRALPPNPANKGSEQHGEASLQTVEVLTTQPTERPNRHSVTIGLGRERRVHCPQCQKVFATTETDHCPLCGADWAESPPGAVA